MKTKIVLSTQLACGGRGCPTAPVRTEEELTEKFKMDSHLCSFNDVHESILISLPQKV